MPETIHTPDDFARQLAYAINEIRAIGTDDELPADRKTCAARLREYCERTEESYKPNGCNAHVAKAFPHLPVYAIHRARVVRQRTGAVVAEYRAPLFRLV